MQPSRDRGLAGRIPAGRSIVVDGAGHLAPLFDPRTANLIINFWSNTTRR